MNSNQAILLAVFVVCLMFAAPCLVVGILGGFSIFIGFQTPGIARGGAHARQRTAHTDPGNDDLGSLGRTLGRAA